MPGKVGRTRRETNRTPPWPKTTTLMESGHRNPVNDRLSNNAVCGKTG